MPVFCMSARGCVPDTFFFSLFFLGGGGDVIEGCDRISCPLLLCAF